MRKAALLAAASVFALGISGAMADVDVDGEVKKHVDINIWENVVVFEDHEVVAVVVTDPGTWAKSDAKLNQAVYYNQFCTVCSLRKDTIDHSVNRNTGITSVNQASGSFNNQGTVISVAFVDGSDRHGHKKGKGNAFSQVAGTQIVKVNDPWEFEHNKDPVATISHSVRQNTGITAVNQSAGYASNQGNAVSIAFSKLDGLAESTVALGQINTGNSVSGVFGYKSSVVTDSIYQNTGITQVNQNAGNMANQGNIVSVSATGF